MTEDSPGPADGLSDRLDGVQGKVGRLQDKIDGLQG